MRETGSHDLARRRASSRYFRERERERERERDFLRERRLGCYHFFWKERVRGEMWGIKKKKVRN